MASKPQKTLRVSKLILVLWLVLYNFYLVHFHANPREIVEICNFHTPFWPFLHSRNIFALVSRKNFKIFVKIVEENSVNFHTVHCYFGQLLFWPSAPRLILPLFSVRHVTINSCITGRVILAQKLAISFLALSLSLCTYFYDTIW